MTKDKRGTVTPVVKACHQNDTGPRTDAQKVPGFHRRLVHDLVTLRVGEGTAVCKHDLGHLYVCMENDTLDQVPHLPPRTWHVLMDYIGEDGGNGKSAN